MFRFKFIVTPTSTYTSSGTIYEIVDALHGGIAKQIVEARWGGSDKVILTQVDQVKI